MLFPVQMQLFVTAHMQIQKQHTGEDCLLRKRLNIVPFILPQEAEFDVIVKLPDKSAKAVF